MSYSTIWTSVADQALTGRITSCLGQELPTGQNPYAWFPWVQWPVVTATDVADAYAYALNAGNPSPGGDEGVVTDAMILAHVQAAVAELGPDFNPANPGPVQP